MMLEKQCGLRIFVELYIKQHAMMEIIFRYLFYICDFIGKYITQLFNDTVDDDAIALYNV